MIILWWLFIAAQFPFDFIVPNIMAEQNRNEYQGIRSAEAFEYENKQVPSNITITEKNEKQCVRLQLSIPRTEGKFSCKVAPDIDGFTDKPVIQWDVQVVKYTFVDNSK